MPRSPTLALSLASLLLSCTPDLGAQDNCGAKCDDFDTSGCIGPACGALTDTEFDFIVVGSGAGGGPLAARLAEAGHSVLVLEAGVDATDVPPLTGLVADLFEPEIGLTAIARLVDIIDATFIEMVNDGHEDNAPDFNFLDPFTKLTKYIEFLRRSVNDKTQALVTHVDFDNANGQGGCDGPCRARSVVYLDGRALYGAEINASNAASPATKSASSPRWHGQAALQRRGRW